MKNKALSHLLSACSDESGSYLIDAAPLDQSAVETMQEVLNKLGFFTGIIYADTISDETYLIGILERLFQFPEYFGRNWDAVDECLADLSWLPAKGYCCILHSAHALRHRDQRVYSLLLDSFRYAADRWQQEDHVPFKLLLG